MLRVDHCPHADLETEGFDRICSPSGTEHTECGEVAQELMDSDLLQELLEPGERSGIFHSQSPIVLRYYGQHQVSFFYVRVQDEIARVELPRWMA